MKYNEVKEKIRQALITATQNRLGRAHLRLKYLIDQVEYMEANLMHSTCGEDKVDVTKARRTATIKKQIENKQELQRIKDSIALWTDMINGEVDELFRDKVL